MKPSFTSSWPHADWVCWGQSARAEIRKPPWLASRSQLTLEIVFETVKSSRKYGNLVRHSACSFVIEWSGEQTVQYEGEARELATPELERFQAVYFKAWPECKAHIQWPGIAYSVVRPKWIRYSDYDQAPPLIREFGEFAIAF